MSALETMPERPRFAAIAASPVFAALKLGPRQLLLPQSDIAILELSSSVTAASETNSIGCVAFEGGQWPVYSVDDSLELDSALTASRYICALLHTSDGYCGLVCDAVDHVAVAELSLQPVPDCMRTPRMLIAALALQDEVLHWVTTAAHFEHWLPVSREVLVHG